MYFQTIKSTDDEKAQLLAGPEFGVEWTEMARSYLPLFEDLPLSEPKKVQMIADLLTVMDHVFEACLAEAAGTQASQTEAGQHSPLKEPLA